MHLLVMVSAAASAAMKRSTSVAARHAQRADVSYMTLRP
jgi:hypothetical protein